LLMGLALVTAGCGGGGGGGPSAAGPQTATIRIDLATRAVTVVEQPSRLELESDDTAAWAGVGNPLSFDLRIKNNYSRLLFNVKAVCTGITGDAAATAVGDGTYDGDPFVYYGPNALDLAATVSRVLTIENISAATGTLELSLSLVNHKMLFGSDDYYDGNLWAGDSAGTATSFEIDINQFGNVGYGSPGSSSGYSNPMNGCCSPDGRYLYYGCRNQPAIITVDTTTMTPTLGVDLTGADNIKMDDTGTGSIGFTRSVSMSPDGDFLYVTLHTGGHLYENSISNYESLGGTIELVRINRSTMVEVDRVVLFSNIDEAQARSLTISADGRRGALAIKVYSDSYGNPAATVQGKFVTLDLTTMTPTIHDVSAIGLEVSQATISPGGSKVYFTIENVADNLLRVKDLGTGTITTVGPAPSFTLEYVKEMPFGPDGRLYIASYNGLAIYNPSNNTLVEPATTGSDVYGIAFSGNGKRYYVMRSDDLVQCFDIATDAPVVAEADGAAEIDCGDGFEEGHAFLCTPY